MSQSRNDAVILDAADNVATALRRLEQGETMTASGAGITTRIAVLQAIPICHKIALRDLEVGARITKYGAVVGEVTEAVRQGGHVHIHNVRSLRARDPGA